MCVQYSLATKVSVSAAWISGASVYALKQHNKFDKLIYRELLSDLFMYTAYFTIRIDIKRL